MELNIFYEAEVDDQGPNAALTRAGLPFSLKTEFLMYVAGIRGGAVALTDEDLNAMTNQESVGKDIAFAGPVIEGSGALLESALNDMAQAFMDAARNGPVATIRPAQDLFAVDVWRYTNEKGLHVTGTALFNGMKLWSPFKTRQP